MKFYENVSESDRAKIFEALDSIEKYGDGFQRRTADFIRRSNINLRTGLASEVRGSGSVQLESAWRARRAVRKQPLSVEEASKFVRLSIARETIDLGGQRGIEGTLVHEGKHALDFALMLSTYSMGEEEKIFDPKGFQREYSAHLVSAFYLQRRGGEFVREGLALGILFRNKGEISINRKGIRARLENNYGLTEKTPGARLSELSFPKISLPRKKWFGIF